MNNYESLIVLLVSIALGLGVFATYKVIYLDNHTINNVDLQCKEYAYELVARKACCYKITSEYCVPIGNQDLYGATITEDWCNKQNKTVYPYAEHYVKAILVNTTQGKCLEYKIVPTNGYNYVPTK